MHLGRNAIGDNTGLPLGTGCNTVYILSQMTSLWPFKVIVSVNIIRAIAKINKNNKIVSKKIFKKFSPDEGSPDGMTLDKYKNLWVAHFHGACISVFDKTAKLIHRIKFPAKNITNCVFGGKNTKELYVSTATKGMNKADLEKFRYSGFFFSVKTNSRGILQKKFILSNEEKRSLL